MAYRLIEEETLVGIGDAIRRKTRGTDTLSTDEMISEIDAYTSDATATADDIRSGTTAYVNGEKVTGNVGIPLWLTGTAGEASSIGSNPKKLIQISTTPDKNYFLTPDTNHSLRADASEFGDATAADVVAGKTFTSADGLKITGTYATNGQYCWKKYEVKNVYEITKTSLGSTMPGSISYPSYSITNDGYFLLEQGSTYINYYGLPSGAINGKTKTIYYKSTNYISGSITYYEWTLSDTYTSQSRGTFLARVTSDDNGAYPTDGIADDGYWYVLVTES